MVYTAGHFAVDDTKLLFDHIDRTDLALLVNTGPEGSVARRCCSTAIRGRTAALSGSSPRPTRIGSKR